MYLRIAGRMVYLCRAVDAEGEVIDADPVKWKQPAGAQTHAQAFEEIWLRSRTNDDRQTPVLRERLENSASKDGVEPIVGRTIEPRIPASDPLKRAQDERFKSSGSVQRFLSTYGAVHNVFNVQRHLSSRQMHQQLRGEAMNAWRAAAAAA
jgi:transposase-like protein